MQYTGYSRAAAAVEVRRATNRIVIFLILPLIVTLIMAKIALTSLPIDDPINVSDCSYKDIEEGGLYSFDSLTLVVGYSTDASGITVSSNTEGALHYYLAYFNDKDGKRVYCAIPKEEVERFLKYNSTQWGNDESYVGKVVYGCFRGYPSDNIIYSGLNKAYDASKNKAPGELYKFAFYYYGSAGISYRLDKIGIVIFCATASLMAILPSALVIASSARKRRELKYYADHI